MAGTVTIRFYEELNDFLKPAPRQQTIELEYIDRRTVKDLIESMGVPHTEVDLILINSNPSGFGRIVEDGDYISVFPVFESIDISSINKLRSKPLRNPRFILDVHLGKLAKYLRLLGFDSLYSNHYADKEIVGISANEHRIILTRDLGLLKRGAVTHGYWLRSTNPKSQAAEIVRKFDLVSLITPFGICLECNGPINTIDRESVLGKVPDGALQYYSIFFHCSGCGRIYWEGSHHKRMIAIINEIILIAGEPY